MRLIAAVTALTFVGSMLGGCYNTYTVTREEVAKLQQPPDGADRVSVQDTAGKPVEVVDSTSLYVRSAGGRRYPVTAFNFSLTESQLVASDRDTLLAVESISDFEVDHVSTWKTVGLISLGVLAAAGVIVGVVVTSGSKSFE